MSVDKTPTGVVYTVTNGTAGQQYPLTFPYIKGADVKAYYVANGKQTVLTYGIQYTVEDQALTTLVALPVGTKLAIYRQTDLTQEIVWKDGQAVYTPDIMKADDKLTLIAQEIAADMSRTVKLTREEEAAGGKPEEVLKNIYDARDAAAASATTASALATVASISAETAAQAVANATAAAVSEATEQANAAYVSATAAAQSAIDAANAVPENLVQRVASVEAKNTQQDTRLANVETKNTQQDTRLTDAETALAGKATTDLGNIDLTKVNVLLQQVKYETGSWASSSALIPMDDTIPQITEGTQVMSVSIVPKKANSKVTVEVKMFISGNGSNHSMVAIFKDSDPNAIASGLVTTSGSNYGLPVVMEKTVSLGDTSPHTFSVRMGPYSGTMYMNGNSSGRLFGGTFVSSITLKEHAA